jgi:lysophospholipase L1-like esterase
MIIVKNLICTLISSLFLWIYILVFDADGIILIIDSLLLFAGFYLLVYFFWYVFDKKIIFDIDDIYVLFKTITIYVIILPISLEVFLRIYSTYSNDRGFVLKYAPVKYIREKFETNTSIYTTHPYLGYQLTPNYINKHNNYHNSDGYRGAEFIDNNITSNYRIVCIGGSTTYCTGVEDINDTYPFILQELLHESNFTNVEVVNAGVGNADSWYSLVNYILRVQYLHPDLVIVYHGDNDLETRFVYPHKRFKSDNTGRLSSASRILINQTIFDHSYLFRILGSNSSFFRYFTGKIYPFTSLSALYSSDFCQYDKFLSELEKPNVYVNKFWLDLLRNNTLKYTKSNLSNLINLCTINNAKVILSTFAFRPSTSETFSEPYQLGISQHNDLSRNLAREYNSLFFDFKSVFPTHEKYWCDDGVHFRAEGNILRAQLFADFIIDNKILYSN